MCGKKTRVPQVSEKKPKHLELSVKKTNTLKPLGQATHRVWEMKYINCIGLGFSLIIKIGTQSNHLIEISFFLLTLLLKVLLIKSHGGLLYEI